MRRGWNRTLAAYVIPMLMVMAFACPAAAHRVNTALTTILLDGPEGVEVIHALSLHDLDHAFGDTLKRMPRIEADSDDVAALITLITPGFALVGPSGAPLALELVGAERDGDMVLVYQLLPAAALGSIPEEGWQGLSVHNRILMDVFPEQKNLVNVELEGEVRSLLFRASDLPVPQPVPFSGSADAGR